MSTAIPSQPDTTTDATPLPHSDIIRGQAEFLKKKLATAIWLPQQIDVTLAKLDVMERPGGFSGGSVEKNKTSPIKFAALEAHKVLRAELAIAVNDIQKCSPVDVGVPMGGTAEKSSPTSALALFVWKNVDYLAGTSFWSRTYEALLAAVDVAASVVDLPEVQEIVKGENGAHWISLSEEARNGWGTPAQIVEVLSGYRVSNLSAKRIATWGSNGLLPFRMRSIMVTLEDGTVQLQGVKTYRIGDVMDKWVDSKNKKSKPQTELQARKAEIRRRYRAKKAAALAAATESEVA